MSDMLDDALAQMDQRLDAESPAPSEPETQAEVQPEAPPEPQAEVPQQERPRDEQGRFTTEQVQEETPTEAEVDWQERYKHLHSKLGEQGNELGELRKERQELLEQFERLNANLTREPEPEPLRVDQNVVDWFDEQLEQNPMGAAEWARSQGSDVLFERALDYWYEDKPRQAAAYERRLEMQNLAKEWENRFQEQTAPFAEVTQRTQLTDAWNAVREKLPDIDNRADKIVEAATRAPALAEGLKSSDPAVRAQSLENLYFLAGGMAGLQNPTPEASPAEQLQTAARDAKMSGGVASQTTSADPRPVSDGDQWLKDIGFDAILDRYSPDE